MLIKGGSDSSVLVICSRNR